MAKGKVLANNLTDEQVLNEFIKHFQCDGAILIYLDSSIEFGFGQWRNQHGRKWVNNLFKRLNEDVPVQLRMSKRKPRLISN